MAGASATRKRNSLRCPQLAAASPWGKLSPKVTDEGRSTYPTGQEKKPVGATAVILFSTKEGWVSNRPSSAPSVRTGAPSPKGKALEVAVLPGRVLLRPPCGGGAFLPLRKS